MTVHQGDGTPQKGRNVRSFFPWGQASWRDDALAISFLFLVATLFFADLLFTNVQLYYGDLSFFYHPSKKILRSIVLNGEFPSWNPYWSAGQPYAANPEFHVFYPPAWLIFLPDFEYAFRFHILLHIYIALVAMYFLLRDIGLRISPSVFGSLAFGLGGFFLSYVKVLPILFAAAWVPLILALSRRWLLRPGPASFAAASLAWGLQLLAAEPTTIVQTGTIVFSYALYASWRNPGSRARNLFRATLMVAALSVSALLVGAVQILPAMDHARDSVRARGFDFDLVSLWSMPLVRPLELLLPRLLGNASFDWGHVLFKGAQHGFIDHFNVGVFTAVLGLAAILSMRRSVLLVAGAIAASFLIAAGSNTPLLRLMYDLGVMRSVRYSEKFAFMGVFALIVLAAMFLDRCLRGDRGDIVAALRVSGLISAIAWLVFALTFTGGYERLFASLWSIPSSSLAGAIARSTRQDWLWMAIYFSAITTLFGLLLRKPAGWVWHGVAVALMGFDLFSTSLSAVGRIDGHFFDQPALSRVIGQSQDYRLFHAADLEDRFADPPPSGSLRPRFWLRRNGLHPRIPSTWGHRSVLENDYDLTNLLSTTDFLHSTWMTRRATGNSKWPETVLRMSNVGHVLTFDSVDARRRIREAVSSGVAFSDINVMRPIRKMYPRYYFADQLVQFRSRSQFIQRLVEQEKRGDRRDIAYVTFQPFDIGKGRVERVTETSNSMRMIVAAPERAYLVISVTPHKYWAARIDGKLARLQMTNIGYQGLAIPAGRHEVTMSYRNPLIAMWSLVSLVTSFSLIGVLLYSCRLAMREQKA